MATGSRKRKILSLEEKVEIIQRSEKNRESARKIAESLGVGKTRIQNILHDKELQLGKVEWGKQGST